MNRKFWAELTKRFLPCLCAAIAILICIFALPTQADAATVDSGTCGKNLTWTLDSSGTLTISGSGAMSNYEYDSLPWYNNRTSIKAAVIQNGVTTIGEFAFYNCTSLTNITIGDSVQSIGDSAFSECTSLTSVTIPNSVTTIGDGVFQLCTSLTSVTIPNSVTTIGNYAFSNCFSLTSIAIPNSVTTIGNYAFSNCFSLTSIAIPNSVTTIGDWAFSDCASLTSITIPDSVTSIGNYVFSGCSSLNYNMYDNAKYLGNSQNPYVVLITATGTSIKSCEIHNSTKIIAYGAFYNCGSLTSIAIPNNVTTIGDYAFSDCTSLESIAIPDSVITIGAAEFRDCTSLESITIPDSITTIGDSAFYNCSSLTSITIPDSVTTIGNYAFVYCTSLVSVTIGDSVTTIGYRAFYNCSNLTQVYIADIGAWLNISFGNSDANPLSVNSNAKKLYLNGKLLTNVTVPSNVTKITDYAFYNCTSLQSVTIPEGVTSIGYSAFSGCINLAGVTIPTSVKTIGTAAFYRCTGFSTVYYAGTADQWVSVQIGSQNEQLLTSVKIQYQTGGPKLSAPKLSSNSSEKTLTWNAIPYAEIYEVYRATSKSGKYTKVATVEELMWQDTAATAGKTYYYKVKAAYAGNSGNSSGYSNVVSINFKLHAPVISVENDNNGKPKLSWSKVTGAKQYTVYVATSQNGTYKKLSTTKSTTYTDSKAKAGTTYFYKVIANASKSTYNSGYSNIVSCGVICGTPSVTVKIDADTGKPSLSWGKVDGAAKYAIYRQLPGEETFTLLCEQTSVTYADKTAPIDTECQYFVQALGKTEDLNGVASKVVSATSGIAKPDVKGSIDAVSGKPVLTWDAIEGAVKYEVYRSTKSNKSYVLIGTVEGCSYTDETVSAGKTYYYQVKAIGQVSKSALSAYDKFTGKCATPVISVANDSKGKPVISWSKVASAKKYTVYRSTNATSGFKSIGTSKTTSYTDTKATPGIVYYYKVIANASSSKYNSGYSNIVSCGCYCGVPAVKVSNNSAGKVTLSWSKISGAVKYEIYLLGAEDYVTLGVVTGTSWTDTEAGIGEGRYYGVRAIAANEDYNSEVSEPVFGRTTCATPKITGKVGTNKKPIITWGEAEGATKYIIHRSTSSSKNYKVIGEVVDGLSYEDLTAAKGKTYYYKVVAVGDSCQSAMSSYVKVKSK